MATLQSRSAGTLQQASYRGQPSDGQFRVTHVAVKVDGQWQFASMQLSPIGQFRPPTSG